MRRTVGSILCGIMLSLVVSLPAMAIDCAKAGSRTENLICATPTPDLNSKTGFVRVSV